MPANLKETMKKTRIDLPCGSTLKCERPFNLFGKYRVQSVVGTKKVLLKYHGAVDIPFEEKMVVLPLPFLQKHLGKEEWKIIHECTGESIFHTGTIVAYETKDKKPGSVIEYNMGNFSIVFDGVPSHAKEEKGLVFLVHTVKLDDNANIVLDADGRLTFGFDVHFEKNKNKLVITPKKGAVIVQPLIRGLGIPGPSGLPIESSERGTVYLYNNENEAFAGLIGFRFYPDGCSNIFACRYSIADDDPHAGFFTTEFNQTVLQKEAEKIPLVPRICVSTG